LIVAMLLFGCARHGVSPEQAPSVSGVPAAAATIDDDPSGASAKQAAGPTVPAAAPDLDPAAPWTIEVADGGTIRIEQRGTRMATFKYVFWGANYAWADPVVSNVRAASGVTTFELKVNALALSIAGRIERSGPGELSVDYAITSLKKWEGVVGGGMEWSLNLGARASAKAGEPELLPDRRGFRWDIAPPDGISASFDPPLPSTYFEQNQKSTIRCFLVGTEIQPGTRKISMRVRLPRGGAVRPSVAERYEPEDRSSWYPQTLEWNRWPVDVGFLNERPAGKRGRVKAVGDRLVFEDGTPVRFWGANVQAYALFHGSKEDIKTQARRMAAMGFNLVRIHHHDSDWVEPNVFDRSGGTTQKLDEDALDLVDWWVKCLEEEGIYVWLDLHVGRKFLPGDDIAGFDELTKQQGSGKGFNYVNPRIEKLMQQFATQYVTRTNRYTKLRYVDDPAVAFVLITNENDLTHHFGPSMLPDKGNPLHTQLFAERAKEFARRAGLASTVTLKSWEPGMGKIALTDIEHGYDRRAIDRLRADGVKALIATTSFWGEEPLYSLPALASGDLVDVHSYGKSELLGVNPHDEPNMISWIGAAQVAGKPLSITEWNVEYPNRDRFVAPLYVAAIAALQGWDAPMIYGYVQTSIQAPENADPWSAWSDPALMASMPAAALLFRQAHVSEAKKTYRLDLSRKTLYYASTNPATSAALRTLVEQSKLTIGLCDIPELPWDSGLSSRSSSAIAFSDVNRDFLPADHTFVESDTGELKRDWSQGVETIDTPRSQAILGWVGGRSIRLRDVTFELATRKATAAVTSLDGQPIATSKKLLVTLVAQAATASGDRLPFLAQPVEGSIAIRTSQQLRMIPLSPKANPSPTGLAAELAPMSSVRRGNEQVFTIKRGVPTHWFMLVP
jgi:hypothetical protein